MWRKVRNYMYMYFEYRYILVYLKKGLNITPQPEQYINILTHSLRGIRSAAHKDAYVYSNNYLSTTNLRREMHPRVHKIALARALCTLINRGF